MKKVFLFAFFAITGLQAGVLTDQCTPVVGPTPTDFTSGVTCNQYNGAQPLLSVELLLDGQIFGNITLTNNGTDPADVTASVTSNIRLFEGATLVLTLPLSYSFTPADLLPGIGCDPGANPGCNKAVSGTLSASDSAAAPGTQPLASYIGGGTFAVGVSTLSGQSSVGGGGNITVTPANNAQATVSVRYTYQDEGQVPEPGTMALLGSGFVGMGLLLRRRKA